jgi:FlaA1/EpsC-like NDP-sugar epimerase
MNISGANILITGGTGSFGNWISRALLESNPQSVAIFSRDEKKQWEMARAFPDFKYLIGDVRDYDRLFQALQGIDIVFHAAALKQVPSCEAVPMEAVKTNILGADNLCRAAISRGVQLVVGLSTDKAVKPTNAMGISKAMMEKILCSQNQRQLWTVFCCVRYGNVMGSRGSVIPLFQSQAAKGQPLTVTDPEMTRFLLTLDDSVSLVFHAMERAKGGEIFVKKAPAARVSLIADAILAQATAGPGARRLHKEIVGIRPGEKMHEVLVSEHEIRRSRESEDFFTVEPEYRAAPAANGRAAGYEYTSQNTCQIESLAEMLDLLRRMGKQESH